MGKKNVDLIKGTGLYIGVSVMAAFLCNYFSPNSITLIGNWDTTQGAISAGARNDPVRQMQQFTIDNVAAAKKIFDNREALFVDARDSEAFRQGHIPGAVSLPLRQFDLFFDSFLQTYGNRTQIITYCSGRECSDSHELAKRLHEIGYRATTVFIDGYEGWLQGGLSIEK